MGAMGCGSGSMAWAGGAARVGRAPRRSRASAARASVAQEGGRRSAQGHRAMGSPLGLPLLPPRAVGAAAEWGPRLGAAAPWVLAVLLLGPAAGAAHAAEVGADGHGHDLSAVGNNAVFGDLAEVGDEDFWANVFRYPRYFLTVMTGAFYMIGKPLFDLLKKPQTAVLFFLIVGGGGFILKSILASMLGMGDGMEAPYY